MKIETINKLLIAIIIITAILFSIAIKLSIADTAYVEGKKDCYQYHLKTETNNQKILIIDTASNLMIEKGSLASNKKDIEKKCNDKGKAMYGKLMKILEVKAVVISDRQIVVIKYSYPEPWGNVSDKTSLLYSVTNFLNSNLCK